MSYTQYKYDTKIGPPHASLVTRKVCTLREPRYVILPSTTEILNCDIIVHKTALNDYFLAVELF